MNDLLSKTVHRERFSLSSSRVRQYLNKQILLIFLFRIPNKSENPYATPLDYRLLTAQQTGCCQGYRAEFDPERSIARISSELAGFQKNAVFKQPRANLDKHRAPFSIRRSLLEASRLQRFCIDWLERKARLGGHRERVDGNDR